MAAIHICGLAIKKDRENGIQRAVRNFKQKSMKQIREKKKYGSEAVANTCNLSALWEVKAGRSL